MFASVKKLKIQKEILILFHILVENPVKNLEDQIVLILVNWIAILALVHLVDSLVRWLNAFVKNSIKIQSVAKLLKVLAANKPALNY